MTPINIYIFFLFFFIKKEKIIKPPFYAKEFNIELLFIFIVELYESITPIY